VLVHGLTATRRYVLHGSGVLERAGYRVISYDARGHGESDPAPEPSAYDYVNLVGDLAAVLDALRIERAILLGASMGAATVVAFALDHPQRVSALVTVTPPVGGNGLGGDEQFQWWEVLADGLEREGPTGFLRVYGDPPVEPRFKRLILSAIRERLERHRQPEALAAAMRAVAHSAPFEIRDLERLEVPTLVVASHDEVDPEHPFRVAETYAERIPRAELISEKPGRPPLAWRGAHLSRVVGRFLERHGLGPRPG